MSEESPILNYMIKPAFILALLFSTLTATGQSRLGVQIEMGSNTLTEISNDTLQPYGYSGAESTVKAKFYASPSIRYWQNLSNKFSLEAGLGYIRQNHEIQLQFYHSFFHTSIDTTLEIKLQYLSIPIAIHYAIPAGPKSSFQLGASVNTNVLLSRNDNFEDIIYEEIGLNTDSWYTNVVLSAGLSLAYQMELKDSSLTEIGLFVNRDVTAFVNKDDVWGYYQNLVPSRSLQFGLQIKYFLKV